jgi:potassium/hydrogen antiporter
MRWGERVFLAWAGPKGAASILLAAVAVLAGYESERMHGIVFIAVVLSVAVPGGTVRHIADRYEIAGSPRRHRLVRPRLRVGKTKGPELLEA